MNFKTIKQYITPLLKHKSFQNFVIIASIAVIQLLNNVILGRNLSKDDFGFYSFIFVNIIQLLSVLLIFGQGTAIVRYFSSKSLFDYRWKKYFLNFSALIFIPLVLVTICIKFYYGFDWLWCYIIIIGVFLMCTSNLLASIFRACGKFNLSVVLERSHPVLFLILLIVPLAFINGLGLKFASFLKLSSFIVVIPFFIYIFTSWKEGDTKVEKKIYMDGLLLWELSITVIVLYQLDAFFIAKILNYSELALYNVLCSVMQIFEFSRLSLFNVYSQKFSKSKNASYKTLLMIIGGVSILVTGFYLVSTNFILDILFKGKYHAPFLLVVFFCIYGIINLFYIVPSCFLIGHSKKKDIRSMMFINISSVAIKVIGILQFKNYGLNGFLVAAIASQLFRTAAGYILIILSKKRSAS